MFVLICLFIGLVNGSLDTSPSSKPYGVCQQVKPVNPYWCNKGPLQSHPLLKPKMKYGRQTVFSGPLGIHKGWCGNYLQGSNSTGMIALSTKYLKENRSTYCGKCVCIQILAVDETSNKYPPKDANKYFGKILKAKVYDQCPECEDDHIDILADRPYSYAPTSTDNPKSKYFNSLPGPRIMSSSMAYGVGVWKVQWNFIDCAKSCDVFFR